VHGLRRGHHISGSGRIEVDEGYEDTGTDEGYEYMWTGEDDVDNAEINHKDNDDEGHEEM
jgi:hypothetical protein